MVTRVLEQVKVFDIIAEGTILRGMGDYDEIPELVYAKEETWESDEACMQALENAVKDWKIRREEKCWSTTSYKPELKVYWKTIDDTFPTCHNDKTCDYEGEDTQENKNNVIYVVSEDNHGVIRHARTREAAIRFLIERNWITGHCEYWIYESQTSKRLDELFEDWKKWLFEEATDEDFECLGFRIDEETLYE